MPRLFLAKHYLFNLKNKLTSEQPLQNVSTDPIESSEDTLVTADFGSCVNSVAGIGKLYSHSRSDSTVPSFPQ